MSSVIRRIARTLALLSVTTILPATVGAQPPVYLTQWGSFGSGEGQFDSPGGVATDADGNVYVVDTGNHRIQKFTGAGTYLTHWSSGTSDGPLDPPRGVATDAAGNVYVLAYSGRIEKFTSTGTHLTQWESVGGNGVATDAAGDVYVSEAEPTVPDPFRVQKFTGTGAYVTQWGSAGSGDGQFDFPRAVATDATGNVYVADVGNYRIQKFTGTGTYITQWNLSGGAEPVNDFETLAS